MSSEPWRAQEVVVNELVSEEHYKVANFLSKRQVKAFAQILAVTHAVKEHLYRDAGKVTFLDIYAEELMRLNKAQDGKCVKLAARVAEGGTVRSIFNLSRWKKIISGEERE